ncbi:zinc ribbon domain-containing protein [uncultured Paludibaculum sp.]|uniref:FmdB family zinc ribbon protein n=1 Tax=uncultured Paludibaculum sp. TaxID=1765020 RepID=UPI002AAC1DB9|nr:zinc ribbon domain-containing protein [uncultured Paludibaculum sp.]
MPMYEYRCTECGHLYEQLRRMSDSDKDLVCPRCASRHVERQVSACAVGTGSSSGKGGGCVPNGRFT